MSYENLFTFFTEYIVSSLVVLLTFFSLPMAFYIYKEVLNNPEFQSLRENLRKFIKNF